MCSGEGGSMCVLAILNVMKRGDLIYPLQKKTTIGAKQIN